jgi:hypothetical protein
VLHLCDGRARRWMREHASGVKQWAAGREHETEAGAGWDVHASGF